MAARQRVGKQSYLKYPKTCRLCEGFKLVGVKEENMSVCIGSELKCLVPRRIGTVGKARQFVSKILAVGCR